MATITHFLAAPAGKTAGASDAPLLSKLQSDATTTASESLAELERVIKRMGNDWLDGFMENVLEHAMSGTVNGSDSSHNTTSFLKTPSRAKSHLTGTTTAKQPQPTQLRRLAAEGAARKLFPTSVDVGGQPSGAVKALNGKSEAAGRSTKGMGIKRKREYGIDVPNSQPTNPTKLELSYKPPPPPSYPQSTQSSFDSPTPPSTSNVPFIGHTFLLDGTSVTAKAPPGGMVMSGSALSKYGGTAGTDASRSASKTAEVSEDPFLLRPSKPKEPVVSQAKSIAASHKPSAQVSSVGNSSSKSTMSTLDRTQSAKSVAASREEVDSRSATSSGREDGDRLSSQLATMSIDRSAGRADNLKDVGRPVAETSGQAGPPTDTRTTQAQSMATPRPTSNTSEAVTPLSLKIERDSRLDEMGDGPDEEEEEEVPEHRDEEESDIDTDADGITVEVRRELVPSMVSPDSDASQGNGEEEEEIPEVPETPAVVSRLSGGAGSSGRAAERVEIDIEAAKASSTEEGSSGDGDSTIKASPRKPGYGEASSRMGGALEPIAGSISGGITAVAGGQQDFAVPLNDGSAKTPLKATSTRAFAESSKNAFSPSSITFAALPPRDPLRGRSIGGTKLHRMTNGSASDPVTNTAQTPAPTERDVEVQRDSVVPLKTEDATGSISNQAEPRTKAMPKASVGVASSWLRHALAGAGGEEGLRKSMAAAPPRPSHAPARETQDDDTASYASRSKAEETQKLLDLSGARSEQSHQAKAVVGAEDSALDRPRVQPPFRLLASTDAATKAASRVTTGSTDLPQSTMSRLLANLQEKKEVARVTAALAMSGTRSTIGPLPSSSAGSTVGSASTDLSGKPGRALNRSTMGFSLLVRPEPVPEPAESAPANAGAVVESVETQSEQPTSAPILGPPEGGRQSDRDRIQETVTIVASLPVAEEAGPREAPVPKTSTSRSTLISDAAPTKESFVTRQTQSRTSAQVDFAPSVSRSPIGGAHRHFPISTTPPGTPPTRQQLSTAPVQVPPRMSAGQPKRSNIVKHAEFARPPRADIQSNVKAGSPATRPTFRPSGVPVSRAIAPVAKTSEVPAGSPQVPASATPEPTAKAMGTAKLFKKVPPQVVPIVIDSDSEEDETPNEPRRRLSPTDDLEETVAMLEKDLRLSQSARKPRKSDSIAEPRFGLSRQVSGETDSGQSLTSSQANAGKVPRANAKAGSSSQFMQAADIARKIDGVRPIVGPINSIAKAQQVRAREQELAQKRAADKEAREKRKRDEAAAKAEKDRAIAEAAKKEKDAEERRRREIVQERIRKDAEAKAAKDARERAAGKGRESVAAEQEQLTASQLHKVKPQMKTLKPAALPAAPPNRLREPGLNKLPSLQSSSSLAGPEQLNASTGPTRPNGPKPVMMTGQGLVAPPQLQTTSAVRPAIGQPVRPKTSLLRETIMRAPPTQHVRHSTITPARTTIRPGTSLLEFQRIVAAGGKGTGQSPQLRPEDIELPDIGSDFGYSDADSDDGRPKKKDKDRPSWADSPALRKAAADQAKMNPGLLFGPMPEFKMESIFGGPRNKIRSSSANWGGQDRLTEQEKLEYAKKMNYRALDDVALGSLLYSPDRQS